MSSRKSIKSAFESMMFTWGEPLDVKTAADVMNISRQEAMECFLELKDEYIQEGRGIVIRQINQSFQFVTREENSDYIRRLCTPVKMKKLSQSALEVLAIRGIRCDRVMDGLIKKELVCEKGRADTVGRPILYGTTDVFLKNFGFSSIKDLPEIEDIESIVSGGIAEDAEELSVMDGEGQMQMEI